MEGLQFVVQVFRNGHNTTVFPVVILDWSASGSEVSIEKKNKEASGALSAIEDKMSMYPYLQSIYEALELALRRLVTANLQKRKTLDERNA